MLSRSALSDSLQPHGLYSPPGSSLVEFTRQEYWNGLPYPTPGDLPDSGIEPSSPVWAGGFFTTEPPGK